MSKDYPSDWDSRRKEVYQRDNFTCQNCGRKGGQHGDYELHAHHIVPKSKGGTHRKSNLKTLCKQCHNAIHGNKPAPTRSGYNDSYDDTDNITLTEVINEYTTEFGAKYPLTLGFMLLLSQSLFFYIIVDILLLLMIGIDSTVWEITPLNVGLFSTFVLLISYIWVSETRRKNDIRSMEDIRDQLKEDFDEM
jgi:ribosomal protein S20